MQVHIGIQCRVKMLDKSTNYNARQQEASITEIYSSQEGSSTTPSLFGFTTDTDENIYRKS